MTATAKARRTMFAGVQTTFASLTLLIGLHVFAARAELLSYLAADHVGAASPEEAETKREERPARLFDMETEPVTEGDLRDKWRRVEVEIASELETLRQCRAAGTCAPEARRLIEISAEGIGRHGRARVGLINRTVDLAIAPVSDERQWGVPDHWSAPFETLQSKRGDCEDYAIVKYAALLASGMSADDVKIVILEYLLPRENHAAVAARVDGEWLILDNLHLTLVRDIDVARSIPEFVLDEDGTHRFIWTSRNRRSAANAG